MTYYSALHYAAKAEKSASEAALHNLKNKITNCITEIPQDIKLELSDGVLRAKAGSKIRYPDGKNEDGSLRFDEVVLNTDVSRSFTLSNVKILLAYIQNTGGLAAQKIELCTSGATAPTGTGLFYNTTDNTIRGYTNGTIDTNNKWSLPLAILTADASGNLSIDQVFNGFGYIDSTVFALPGVKGLIPNGRNADGSLRNEEFTTSRVIIYTDNGNNSTFNIVLSSNSTLYPLGCEYDDIDNIIKYNGDNAPNRYIIGKASFSSGKVTSFVPKLPFHAVDRNDSSWVAQQAMPSNKYIDLTLGASGTSYTAPANGWVMVQMKSSGAGQFLQLHISGLGLGFEVHSVTNGETEKLSIPVGKGKPFSIVHNFGGGVNAFRFIYAEGETN